MKEEDKASMAMCVFALQQRWIGAGIYSYEVETLLSFLI